MSETGSGEGKPARVLVVEDELILAEDIAFSLTDLNYEVAGIASNSEQALRMIRESKPDLILMDINLSGEIDGIELAEFVWTRYDAPVIYLTGYSERNVLDRAKRTHPYGYLNKPIIFSEFRSTIETALYKHQADRRIRQSEARLAKAEDLAHLGSWEWNLSTGDLMTSEGFMRLFGLDPASEQPKVKTFFKSVHPLDRERVEDTVYNSLKNKQPYDIEFRLVKSDGDIRVIHSRADMAADSQGAAVKMMGMALDVTERKKIEDMLSMQRDLSFSISAVSNLGEALDLCIDSSLKISGMEAGGICLVNDDSTIDLVAHRGFSDDFIPLIKAVVCEQPGSNIFYEVGPVYCCRDFSELSPKIDEIFRSEGFLAGTAIPILHHGRMIAGIFLVTRIHDEIDKQTRDALETIALQMGAAVARIRAEETAHRDRRFFESLIDSVDEGLAVKDKNGRFIYANRKLAEVYGLVPADLVGNPSCLRVLPERRKQKLKEAVESGRSLVFEDALGDAHFENFLTPVMDSSGVLEAVAIFSRNITERKNAQESFKVLSEKYGWLHETMSDAFAGVNMDGRITEFNQAFRQMLGYSEEELRRLTYEDITPEPWRAAEAAIINNQVLKRGFSDLYEKEYRKKDGTVFPVELRTVLIKNERGENASMWAVVRDISGRKIAQERLEAALREKEIVLQEIHRRVTNNLAVVQSLLRVQAHFINNEGLDRIVDDTQNRIRAISLAHELLYKSEEASKIKTGRYVRALTEQLLAALSTVGKRIEIKHDVREADLELDTIIPLGLILTELISNSFKHAFAESRVGSILISLQPVGDGEFELIVKDDGVGLSERNKLEVPNSLGFSLLRIFVAQLRGTMRINGKQGTEVTVRFKDLTRLDSVTPLKIPSDGS